MSKKHTPSSSGTEPHLEDKGMKVAAQYFGSEMLPRLGIKGKRQFRTYEAYISYTYGVEVTTYVICTSKVKRIRSELREGINTYRVKVIRMKDRDGDVLIGQLERKQNKGRKLKRAELAELILTPLMGGESTQKERIKRGMTILQNESPGMDEEDVKRMQSVLYAFAVKFLDHMELKELKEGMTMTILGQMLMEDGIQKGKAEGELLKLISQVRKKLAKGLSAEEIADVFEEDPKRIQKIVAAIQRDSEAEDDVIYSRL